MAPIAEPVGLGILRGLLIPLSVILVWGFGAAVAHSAIILTRALFGTASSTVSWVPWLGKKLSHGLEHVSQRVSNWFGEMAAKADNRVGLAFHDMGALVSSFASAVTEIAIVSGETVTWLVRKIGVAAIGPRLNHLTKTTQTATKAQAQVNRRARADHAAIANAHAGPIGAAIHERVGPLQAEVARLQRAQAAYSHALPLDEALALPGQIGGLRARVKESERVAGRLWDRVKGLDKVVTGLGAAALVASMIGRLGGGWIFCRNWKTAGRTICKLPFGTLEGLLGLLTDVLVLTDICRVLPLLEEGFAEVAEPFINAFTDASFAVCYDPALKAPALPIPQLYLPASADMTLHLV